MLSIPTRRTLLSANQPITYLLGPFRFSTDASAPLASPYTEAGAVGSLTVTDTGNKLTISTGRVRSAGITGGGDPRLIYATGFTRRVGLALLATTKWTVDRACFGWTTAATPSGSSLYGYNNIGATPSAYPALAVAVAGTIDSGTGADLLVILRGTGAYMFSRNNGSSGPYTLDYVDNTDTTSPLYPGMWAKNTDFQVEADNLRCIDLGPLDARFATDYGLALNRSTFTAANGTALTAITPEAGGVWTARDSSIFQIQSNKVVFQTQGSNIIGFATVACSSADIVAECTVNFNALTGSPESCLLLRTTDNNNYWLIDLETAASRFALYEKAAGVTTLRASVAFTFATGTDYRIVVTTEGSTITAYLNNANKITYASASSGQTVTTHGLLLYPTGKCTVDDFAIFQRTLTLPAGV